MHTVGGRSRDVGCDSNIIYVSLWCGIQPHSPVYACIVEEVKLQVLHEVASGVPAKQTIN